MTIEQAYAEMQRRGWGYARSGEMIAVGPITNPRYAERGEPPMIDVYAMGIDAVEVVQQAIVVAATRSNGAIHI